MSFSDEGYFGSYDKHYIYYFLKTITEHSPPQLQAVLDESSNICVGLMITCAFINDLASGCVAVVHERTAYINSAYGLLNIDVYYFPLILSSDNSKASGCLVNKSTTKHHVAVFLYINRTIGDQIVIKHKG